jgi:uncharacterized protein YcsI (UPF0317 family)
VSRSQQEHHYSTSILTRKRTDSPALTAFVSGEYSESAAGPASTYIDVLVALAANSEYSPLTKAVNAGLSVRFLWNICTLPHLQLSPSPHVRARTRQRVSTAFPEAFKSLLKMS